MNIYLDINGVVLKKDLTPAPYLKEFLTSVLSQHEVFWLTTHCQGDAQVTVDYLSRFFPEEYLKLFRKIKPTRYNVLKTDAIDFNSDFRWFDDSPLEADRLVLMGKGRLDSLILIDLNRTPNTLKDLLLVNVLFKNI